MVFLSPFSFSVIDYGGIPHSRTYNEYDLCDSYGIGPWTLAIFLKTSDTSGVENHDHFSGPLTFSLRRA